MRDPRNGKPLLPDEVRAWRSNSSRVEPASRSARTNRKGKLVTPRVPRELMTVLVSGLRPGHRTKFVHEVELDLRGAGKRTELEVVVE